MRLAVDTELRIGHETIRLRPTLRAAFSLDQKYDGFGNLSAVVTNGSLTAIADIIKAGCGHDTDLANYLNEAADAPLGVALDTLIPQIMTFLMALAGHDDTAKADATPSKPMTFAAYHTRLFQMATGWLGWFPTDAWNATPAEIINAYKGRCDMLKAIFGGNEDTSDNDDDTPLRERLQRIKGIGDLTKRQVSELT